jgi:hypothetical protein
MAVARFIISLTSKLALFYEIIRFTLCDLLFTLCGARVCPCLHEFDCLSMGSMGHIYVLFSSSYARGWERGLVTIHRQCCRSALAAMSMTADWPLCFYGPLPSIPLLFAIPKAI